MTELQYHRIAEPPVVPATEDCRRITGPDELDAAIEAGELVLDGRHGRPVSRSLARERAEKMAAGEPYEFGLAAAEDPLPDDPETAETETFFHVSPEQNVDEIAAEGLDVSAADNTPTLDGVYVAPTRADAENWAHVLCAEEGDVWFALYRVEVPAELPVLSDERVRDPDAYPDSNVLATAYGVPARFLEEVDRVKAKADLAPRPRKKA